MAFEFSSSAAGVSSLKAGMEADQLVEGATDADADAVPRDVLDVPNDSRSPHKHASKSSSKSKKRSTDRKRKGSSWYNVSSAVVVSFLPCCCCFFNALILLVNVSISIWPVKILLLLHRIPRCLTFRALDDAV